MTTFLDLVELGPRLGRLIRQGRAGGRGTRIRTWVAADGRDGTGRGAAAVELTV